MKTEIELFSDGAFTFQSPHLGYGWVAAYAGVKVMRGRGQLSDDGSRNFAAEAFAALAALKWAVAQGYRQIHLHSDFNTLGKHLRKPYRRSVSYAAQLFGFCAEHPEIEVRFSYTSDAHQFLREAHHLARAAVTGL